MRRTWRTALFACTLVLLGTAALSSPAHASDGDRLRGWLWSDRVGWFSVNCLTAGGCPPEYGVDIADVVSAQPDGGSGYSITGWAWSKNVGWMCFGSTCNGEPDPPPGVGAEVPAYVDAGFEVHGWGKIISLKNRGWVSLNCDNIGAIGCSEYFVAMNLDTGTVTGFGWNGNDDGTGVGWIDFSTATLVTNETLCADGVDNDLDGRVDCADPDCLGAAGPGGVTCGPESSLAECTDVSDNDGDGRTDCMDNLPDVDGDACWHQEAYGCPATELVCDDGVDNDVDNGFGAYDDQPTSGADCTDTDCLGVGACANEEALFGGPGNEAANCSDAVDNDGDAHLDGLDCTDSSCAAWCPGICEVDNALRCMPVADPNQCPTTGDGAPTVCEPVYTPWLQALFEDIYSRRGIRAENPPPAGEVNATFCLLSAGGETARNFVVQSGTGGTAGCDPVPSPEDVTLPTAATQYASPLGRIDVAGIKKGAYGRVTTLQPDEWNQVPDVLDGRVFSFPDGLDINGARAFRNAARTRSGAGLVFVEGALTINADLTYAAAAPAGALRNLASLGVVVVDKRATDGSLLVPAQVTVSGAVTRLVGASYTEGTYSTGASDTLTLSVEGLLIARQFDFARTTAIPEAPTERITYDGRAVANPPPGMADVVSSLPTFTEVAPR